MQFHFLVTRLHGRALDWLADGDSRRSHCGDPMQVCLPYLAIVALTLSSHLASQELRDVMKLEAADVVQLEHRLARNPADLEARLKAMAYYARGDRAGRSEDLAGRLHHTLWLIEHQPQSDILHSYVAQFTRSQLTDAEYHRAVALWQAAVAAHPADAAIRWNAASFLRELDPALHLRYLEATAAADPNHPLALRPLAHLYADALTRGGVPAQHAEAALARSNNVWILGNAAHVLQHYYNQSLQSGAPNRRIAELAERYFERAKRLDPKLNRNAILPQIDLQSVARAHEKAERSRLEWEARFKAAVPNVRRLPPEAFPQLPGSIAEVLRARKCTVPQPSLDGPPRNVISGQFYAKGQIGWAVLCSVNHSTSLLVFRHSRDANPEVLDTSEDLHYLQGVGGDQIGYSRQITAVGRDFILGHYRAYGGPEPPPIDHHGIDDAFLEKASVTRYFHRGKWLSLQGAD